MSSEVHEVRIPLDEEMLRDLLAGQVVTVPVIRPDGNDYVVQFALKDIGWDRIQRALDDAMRRR
jgi:hypothetical protein